MAAPMIGAVFDAVCRGQYHQYLPRVIPARRFYGEGTACRVRQFRTVALFVQRREQ